MHFFVTCARGTEGALRRELVSLRIYKPRGDRGGVSFEGTLDEGMAVCLYSRVAVRVLAELASFPAGDAQALYAGARAVDWTEWLDRRSTLAVRATVDAQETALRHTGFAALKVKDAVVDALRDRLGERPDVDVRDPDVRIVLHVSGGQGRLFLDLAGEPLHKRGYRVAMVDAPLKETLAAAVLALGGVDPAAPFVDPMGGSGTLAIEHALTLRRRAPGLTRRFGFERWPRFEGTLRTAWERLKEQARAVGREAAGAKLPPIVCADVSTEAIDAARRNAITAGVIEDITFRTADVRALDDLVDRSWRVGTLCTNPPYGERLGAGEGEVAAAFGPPRDGRGPRGAPPWSPREPGREQGRRDAGRPRGDADETELRRLYGAMVVAFRRLSGWRLIVLSGNPAWGRAMPLRPEVTHKLFNGPLEVRLLVYQLR